MLQNISIHLNIDGLEGGMDGLAQVLACPEVCVCAQVCACVCVLDKVTKRMYIIITKNPITSKVHNTEWTRSRRIFPPCS